LLGKIATLKSLNHQGCFFFQWCEKARNRENWCSEFHGFFFSVPGADPTEPELEPSGFGESAKTNTEISGYGSKLCIYIYMYIIYICILYICILYIIYILYILYYNILYILYIHNTYIYKNMTEYWKERNVFRGFGFVDAGNLWKIACFHLILFYGIPPIKQPFLRGLLILLIQGWHQMILSKHN